MTSAPLAWTGELMLLEAKWNDKDGHMARFRIASPNEDRPNPFKAFTKRRGKRAGTVFHAVMSPVVKIEKSVAYDGELMLAGWGDTSTQGYTVTFWMEPPDAGNHPLEGYARNDHSFMVALVEMGDDGIAVDQKQRERVEAAHAKAKGGEPAESAPAVDDRVPCDCTDEGVDLCKMENPDGVWCFKEFPHEWAARGGTPVDTDVPHGDASHDTKVRHKKTLANWAAMLCHNELFWEWLNYAHVSPDSLPITTAEHAARWMKEDLEIESRRELDTDSVAAERYHRTIRKPFVAWNEERVTS